MSTSRPRSPWASRFMAAAVVQGSVAFAVMAALLYLALFGRPAASRVVAAGGAGTWFVVGVVAFALGILCTAVSALFYHHVEVSLGAPYRGWRTYAAWAHLVLGGVGGVAAALLTTYGGLVGGGAMLPASVGGGGHDAGWVHENVLGPLVVPIAAASAVTLLGYLAGGVGYVAGWASARRGRESL